jgi:predicted dehydrogenase
MCSRGVIGTKGTATLEGPGFFDFMTYRVITDTGESITQINDLFDSESYYTENLHFIECIKTGTSPIANEDNGVIALKVSLAALESAKSGQFISVEGSA